MSAYLGVASGAEGVVCFQAERLSAARWRLARAQLSLVDDPYLVAANEPGAVAVGQRLDELGLGFDRAARIGVNPRLMAHIARQWDGVELVTDDDEALGLLMHCAVSGVYLPMDKPALSRRCRAIAAAMMAVTYYGSSQPPRSARRRTLQASALQDGQSRRQRLDRHDGLGRIVDVVRRGFKIFFGVRDQGLEARGVDAFGQVAGQYQRAQLGGGQLFAEKVVVHRFGSLSGLSIGREPRVGGGGQTAPADEGEAP